MVRTMKSTWTLLMLMMLNTSQTAVYHTHTHKHKHAHTHTRTHTHAHKQSWLHDCCWRKWGVAFAAIISAQCLPALHFGNSSPCGHCCCRGTLLQNCTSPPPPPPPSDQKAVMHTTLTPVTHWFAVPGSVKSHPTRPHLLGDLTHPSAFAGLSRDTWVEPQSRRKPSHPSDIPNWKREELWEAEKQSIKLTGTSPVTWSFPSINL